MGLVRRATQTLGVHEGPARGLLMMCLATTGVFGAAHVARYTVGVPGDVGFDLGVERGFGEVFFMVMTVWTAALLARVSLRTRSGVLLAWAGAFVVVFVDDWFTIHERVGGPIGARLGMDYHVGELVWMAGLAGVLGLTLLVLHFRSRGEARGVSAVLFGLALGLLFCGAVLDLVHGRVTSPVVGPYVTLLEDGGEIAVMSLVVSFVFAVAYTGHRPRVGRRWGTLFGVDRMLQRDP